MFNLFKNKNQTPLQSSAVLRVIGDRTSGKTTYMASLARWPNADPDSPVQAVTAVDEGGKELLSKAQNILEQGLQLEQTDLSKNVSEVKDCTLQITLKEKKLGAKLLNLNVSSKDYAGEFFTDLLHKVKDPLLNEYLEDCLQCNGILFLVDGRSRRKDLEYDNGLVKSITNNSGTQSYEYDSDGNLTKFTDLNGNVINYSYDLVDRKFSVSSISGTTTYSFNTD
ncbi:MAG: hypothetical protein ACK5QF_13865, partial [Dolichospermum sp.]